MPQATLSFYSKDEPVWPEIQGQVSHFLPDVSLAVARVRDGMASGAPLVFIRMQLADGTYVVGETSQAIIFTLARAIEARTQAEEEGEL